ncbi:hypothetical protein J2T13_002532 [Paenibacillus sp. DS2015]
MHGEGNRPIEPSLCQWRRTDMTVEQLISLLVLIIMIIELAVRKGKS